MDTIGLILIVFGVFLFAVGVLGVIRLPDALSRLHASGKVSALGLIVMLIGGSFMMTSATPKLILLGLFLLASSPVASHAIATTTLVKNGRPQPDKQ